MFKRYTTYTTYTTSLVYDGMFAQCLILLLYYFFVVKVGKKDKIWQNLAKLDTIKKKLSTMTVDNYVDNYVDNFWCRCSVMFRGVL
jgi:hypothetical protein